MKQEKGLTLVALISIIVILLITSGIVTYSVISSKKSEDIDNNDSNVIEEKTEIGLSEELNLDYTEDGAFLMTIDSVYTWAGRGTMVEGKILRGTIKTGDTVQILGMDVDTKTTTIARIEQSRTEIPQAKIGEEVTVLLSDYHRSEIIIGQVLAQEDSILVRNNIEASVVMNNDNSIETLKNLTDLKCYIRNTEIPIEIKLNPETEGNIINVKLENSIAVEKGMKFNIKDNNSSVAECTILNIY